MIRSLGGGGQLTKISHGMWKIWFFITKAVSWKENISSFYMKRLLSSVSLIYDVSKLDENYVCRADIRRGLYKMSMWWLHVQSAGSALVLINNERVVYSFCSHIVHLKTINKWLLQNYTTINTLFGLPLYSQTYTNIQWFAKRAGFLLYHG